MMRFIVYRVADQTVSPLYVVRPGHGVLTQESTEGPRDVEK